MGKVKDKPKPGRKAVELAPPDPLRLEWLDADSLNDNPANWRTHPEPQANALRDVLEEVGWAGALLFNERTGRLVDGHLRKKVAAGKRVPVLIGNWTEEQERKILATLDPIAAMATADRDRLDALLRDVQTGSEALAGMLTELAEKSGIVPSLNGHTPEDAGPQVDRAAELLKKWKVKPGQVWTAGKHVIICGDCREPETWARLLSAAGVEKANGVFTSPPYAEQRKEQYGGVPADEYVGWWEAVQANARTTLADDGSFFVNIKPHCEDGERVLYVFDLVLAMKRRWGWRFVDEFCWRNTRDGVPGGWDNRFKNAFEPVYQFATASAARFCADAVKHRSSAVFEYSPDNAKASSGLLGAEKANGYKEGMARPSNVVECPAESAGLGHDAPFPIALPAFFVKAYSDSGDVWLDPFLGSGTTVVAAHQNGRRGLGIEQAPKYVAVILERLAALDLSPRLADA